MTTLQREPFWQEFFKSPIRYGRFSFQVYLKEKKYEVVRYGSEGEYDTVLHGHFYDCKTTQDKIKTIADDLRGLADTIEEEAAS